MTDLFDIPESLSPKEAWKRNHNVQAFPPNGEGRCGHLWLARYNGGQENVYGEDEECALYLMSLELGVSFYKIVC